MKVLFEQLTEHSKTILSVEQIIKESVTVSIDYTKLFDEENRKTTGIIIDKKQLSDFIGALLHIQSKIRR